MLEELHQAPAHAGLDHGLDLLVRTVREVAQSPAGVREDLLVRGVDQLAEGGEGALYHLEVGLGLAAAEVAKWERKGKEKKGAK